MGMYDELTCKYPLPEEYADMQDREFQTKSLERLLDQYTITREGELWVTLAEREWVEDSNSALGGYFKTLREWDERVEDFHGDLYFYDFRVQDVPQDLVTFRARFTHGKLGDIIVVPNRDAIVQRRSVR